MLASLIVSLKYWEAYFRITNGRGIHMSNLRYLWYDELISVLKHVFVADNNHDLFLTVALDVRVTCGGDCVKAIPYEAFMWAGAARSLGPLGLVLKGTDVQPFQFAGVCLNGWI
jgi:hypothetical protein